MAKDEQPRAAFTPRGYEAGVRDLQRVLGKQRPELPSKPPRAFTWLRRHGWIVTDIAQVNAGMSIAIGLRDGRVFVGDVEFCGPQWVTVLLWGVRGPAVEFQTAAVERCTLVGPHPWTEECEVRKRQGAGLPAMIVLKTEPKEAGLR